MTTEKVRVYFDDETLEAVESIRSLTGIRTYSEVIRLMVEVCAEPFVESYNSSYRKFCMDLRDNVSTEIQLSSR